MPRKSQGRKGRKRNPLIAETDSEGRPVGVGGASRRDAIDSAVNEANTGRMRRNQTTDEAN